MFKSVIIASCFIACVLCNSYRPSYDPYEGSIPRRVRSQGVATVLDNLSRGDWRSLNDRDAFWQDSRRGIWDDRKGRTGRRIRGRRNWQNRQNRWINNQRRRQIDTYVPRRY